MFGSDIVKAFGVGADWLFGNLYRKIFGKPSKTYKEIWNGDTKGDDMDSIGYNLFYIIIGFIAMGALVYIVGWLLYKYR
jgi:hypothetical protein